MARGGKRSGSGRKPSVVEKLRKGVADQVFAQVNEVETWVALIHCGNPKVIADVMKYLTDRRDGKPMQPVSGPNGGAIPVQVINDIPRAQVA